MLKTILMIAMAILCAECFAISPKDLKKYDKQTKEASAYLEKAIAHMNAFRKKYRAKSEGNRVLKNETLRSVSLLKKALSTHVMKRKRRRNRILRAIERQKSVDAKNNAKLDEMIKDGIN